MNQVFKTETFGRLYLTLTEDEQVFVDKVKNHLVENLEIGKPLRFWWLSEKSK